MATVEELEKRIGDLEDMRAIERLQAEYWDTLDAKDWDGLRACLVEDFVFVNNTTDCYLKSRTKPKLLDRMLIIEYGIERHVDLLLRGIRI